MKHSHLSYAYIIGLLLAFAAGPAGAASDETNLRIIQGPPTELDEAGKAFIDEAASYHAREMGQAEAMMPRSQGAVRNYAERLSYDHAQALDELGLVASMHAIEVQQQPAGGADTPGEGEEADETRQERDFLESQVERHEAALERFRAAGERIEAPNLHGFIEATVPMIAEHLKIAKRLLREARRADDPLEAMSQVERGEYLARIGDCASCHTREGGQPYEGGQGLKTPFGGYIYSANITPSPAGILHLSDEAFVKAMHEGIGPDGRPYYPAFPYPSYTKVSRDDLLAIKAYLETLEPSDYEPPQHDIPWWLRIRSGLHAWRALFFEPGRFTPARGKSEEWNRGAYLVQGLGHCGGCHTPRNALGAKKEDHALAGGEIEGWKAPDLTRGGFGGKGLSRWSVEELASLLQTGAARADGRLMQVPESVVLGPMAEVVHKSLSYLTDADARAMAVYLKDPPFQSAARQRKRAESQLDPRQFAFGKEVYAGRCVDCHGSEGQGKPPYVPALRGNPVLDEAPATNLVMSIVAGARAEISQAFSPYMRMPAFAEILSDNEIAAVANYVLSSWGEGAVPVTPGLAAHLRAVNAAGPPAQQ